MLQGVNDLIKYLPLFNYVYLHNAYIKKLQIQAFL